MAISSMPARWDSLRTFALTTVTMIFFAANSILARIALRGEDVDGVSYTTVRVLAGAVMMALIVSIGNARGNRGLQALKVSGSWRAAGILMIYAIPFSLAFRSLSTGIGTLILFASVQFTMIAAGIRRGEGLVAAEAVGLALAFGGLIYLVSPGISAPPLAGALLMATAGIAWGFYSLAARGVASPTIATAGNFFRAAPIAVAAFLIALPTGTIQLGARGLWIAAASGAITSALGYVIWYTTLKRLTTNRAAIVQLTVPIIAALFGVLFLGEQMSARLAISATAILGGVALALSTRPLPKPAPASSKTK